MDALPTGLVILFGHNLWAWDWPVFVAVAGWGMTKKVTIYIIFPTVPNRMIGNTGRSQRTFGGFCVVGAVMSALGVVRTWHAFAHLQAERAGVARASCNASARPRRRAQATWCEAKRPAGRIPEQALNGRPHVLSVGV